jgi:hypothetical protein
MMISRRGFATYKSAHPETPLAFYRATAHATSSINHRLFYVNLYVLVNSQFLIVFRTFMIWAIDTANSMLDW